MKIFEINNLSFSYKKDIVLNEFTQIFDKGKIYTILGHNGAGKTTLIRLCLGLLEPNTGSIVFFDNPIVSYVPDKAGLFEFLTVEQNIKLFLKLNNVSAIKSTEYLNHSIEKWKLVEKRNTLIHNLSMGQKQRVSLIVAEVNSPNIIFLDEPTNSIDIFSQELLNNHLNSLRLKGVTIILASHDIQLIENISDEIIIIDNHRISYKGKLDEIENLTEIYRKFTEEDIL